MALNNGQRVCQYLQNRPIALFDSEYGCAPLSEATAEIAADKLMRIRSNRCLWSAPPAYNGKGRPKIHGQQFRLKDSQSWWAPEQTLESVEPKLGKIRLRKWDDLHFRGSPKHPMTLILVERLETVTGRLNSQPLWLVWVGIQMPSLAEIWQLYLRRFALEHWYRLALTNFALDCAKAQHIRTLRTMERFDAFTHLAIMVS